MTGLLLVLGFFVLLVAALAWQATRGGISLDLLRGPIEASVRARLPAEADVTIGATALSYDFERGVVLRAREVKLAFPGAASIDADELSTVTTIPALLGGRIDLSAIVVSGIEIGVELPAGGEVETSGAELIRSVAASLGRQWVDADDVMRRAGLEGIVVRETLIRIFDGAGAPGPALEISEAHWEPLDTGASQGSPACRRRDGRRMGRHA